MSNRLTITENEWLDELEQAQNAIGPRKTNRKLTKKHLEFIKFAKNKNYTWQVITNALNAKFKQDFKCNNLRRVWADWRNREKEW